MGKQCSLCGEFNSSIENDQFIQYTKEKIVSLTKVKISDLDSMNTINCEVCGQSFCIKCFQKRQYNGKSISKYIEIFDHKYHTTASKSYVSDMYVCEKCAKMESSSKCHTCGKQINQDLEGIFSGKHVGHHVKCTKCDALICLDCATENQKAQKFVKACPFCNAKKWLPIKIELLFTHFTDTIIHLNERQGFKCKGCNEEKTILLVCKRSNNCGDYYCPECLINHDLKLRGNCPSCKKRSFSHYTKKLKELAKKTFILPRLDIIEADDEPKDVFQNIHDEGTENIEEIHPDVEVLDDEIRAQIDAEKEVQTEITNFVDYSTQEESNSSEKTRKIKSSVHDNYDENVSDEYEITQDSFDLKEDIRRLVRISNLVPELKEFMQGMKYSIQYELETGEKFYLKFTRGKMIGSVGTLPNPSLKSGVISPTIAQKILHGIPDIDFDFLKGDLELISHFMDFHDIYDMTIHA